MEKSKLMYGRKKEVIFNKSKVKDLWDCGEDVSDHHGELIAAGVFPWPPRSYTCSFCKREFRSAQALGGHMNVHRRDRARLRQSPPRDGGGQFSFLNLNLEPNPNLNFISTTPKFSSPSMSTLSSPSRKCPCPPPPVTSRLPPLFAPPLFSTPPDNISEMREWGKEDISQMSHPTHKAQDFGKIRDTKRLLELEKLGTGTCQKDGTVMKKAESVSLGLEIGLLGQEHEDLDLELRLGCT